MHHTNKEYLQRRSRRWPKGFELHLRDFSSQSSQGGRVEGVSRLGEWMGLKSVLTCEGAHLPYGQAMRSWLPQDTHQLAACGGCSCQGSPPPRPRVPTRTSPNAPRREELDARIGWCPNMGPKGGMTQRGLSPETSEKTSEVSGVGYIGDITAF